MRFSAGLHAAFVSHCGMWRWWAATVDAIEAVDLAVKLRPDVAIVAVNALGMDGIETDAPDSQVRSVHARPDPVDACTTRIRVSEKSAPWVRVKRPGQSRSIERCGRVSKGKRYMSDAVSNLVIGDIAAERTPGNSPLSLLTERRRSSVLALTASGKSSAASAKFLGLSPRKVETYRSRILRKLEIRDITGL